MPRGGARKGTPGKAYSNRTDLGTVYTPSSVSNTAGTGGLTSPVSAAPAAPSPSQAPQPGPPTRTPQDSPNLTDPTQRPDEPVTAGLPMGPGPGPAPDPRLSETRNLKKYLPLIAPYLDRPDVEDSVRTLFLYIKSS